MRAWSALLVSCAIANAFADAAARAVPVELTVKPVLCITDRHNPSCEMSLSIAWRSDIEGDYCLHRDGAPAAISCWTRVASGRVEEARVVAEPLTYWLTSGEAGGVRLAETTVDVVSTETDDRRRNRQRRHAWSLL